MITVIGAGAWGTALALQLAKNNNIVNLWDIDDNLIQILQTQRINTLYIPDVLLPNNIVVHSTLKEALENTRDILIVVPSHAFKTTLIAIKPHINNDIRIAWGTKGLDQNCDLLHNVVKNTIGDIPMASVSGPSFATEVALGRPTAITVASNNKFFAEDLNSYLHIDKFRVYTSQDLIGVEISGAIKNVLAIAVGISDGMDLGVNAKSALIARGLAESVRLGNALGGKPETFMGLAGLGDLVLTCTDNQSRNRRFGLSIGKGKSVQQAQQELGLLAEGVSNTKNIYVLAQKHKIEMPIVEQTYNILYNDISPLEGLNNLLNRAPKMES